MSLKTILRFSFIFIGLILITSDRVTATSQNQKQVEVSLRMLGHEILNAFGDSISRILPITQVDGGYRIQFESDFGFHPEELVATVKRVVQETELANSYFIEIEDCAKREIVYSFKVDNSEDSDIIPCKERGQPKACYSIIFTIAENGSSAKSSGEISTEPVKTPDNEKGISLYFFLAIIPLAILISLVFIRSKKGKSEKNPNLITIGQYQFDVLNTELLIDDKKIELTGKEADLLKLLFEQVNATVEKELILNKVWGDEGDYIGRTLDVFISKLRKKLEYDANLKIVNIRGVGYKLIINK